LFSVITEEEDGQTREKSSLEAILDCCYCLSCAAAAAAKGLEDFRRFRWPSLYYDDVCNI
jgi:hypothetical protein